MSLSILTPLNLELPLKPQLNRRFPHELHWRVAPPKWGGNIKGAYARLYPGMVDGECCMQCGAVPCPYDHVVAHETRLKDLEFIKELAKERRGMKDKIAKLEDSMSNHLERQRAWKQERIKVKEKLRLFESLKRDWDRERKKLDCEMKQLQGLNDKQQVLLQNARRDQQKILNMNKQIADLEAERDEQKDENKKFRQMIVSQSTKMSLIESQFDNLQRDLKEATNKVRTMTVQLDESTEQLQRVRKQLWDKEAQLQEMDSELDSLIGTLETKTRTFEQKEAESLDVIRELRQKINGLRDMLHDAQHSNKDLDEQIVILVREIERLKQCMMSDQRFKQFVDIKRQNSTLKSENEKLSLKVLETESQPRIPMMRSSGKITVKRSRVMSAGGGQTAAVSAPAFSSEAKLQRPKSSNVRTLVSMSMYADSGIEVFENGQTSL